MSGGKNAAPPVQQSKKFEVILLSFSYRGGGPGGIPGMTSGGQPFNDPSVLSVL